MSPEESACNFSERDSNSQNWKKRLVEMAIKDEELLKRTQIETIRKKHNQDENQNSSVDSSLNRLNKHRNCKITSICNVEPEDYEIIKTIDKTIIEDSAEKSKNGDLDNIIQSLIVEKLTKFLNTDEIKQEISNIINKEGKSNNGHSDLPEKEREHKSSQHRYYRLNARSTPVGVSKKNKYADSYTANRHTVNPHSNRYKSLPNGNRSSPMVDLAQIQHDLINFKNEIILAVETIDKKWKRRFKSLEHLNAISDNKSFNINETLKNLLPAGSMKGFLSFEKLLSDSPEHRKALINAYRIITCGGTSVRNCIRKIMSYTVKRDVETMYSGTGKKFRGITKRNFSKTQTYSCLEEALIEKFGYSPHLKNLPGQVGQWISGNVDRYGGRKERLKKKINLKTTNPLKK